MTLTVVATSQPLAYPPRVRIDITSTTDGPMATVGGANFVVYRVHASGERFPVLLDTGVHLTSGAWSGFDHHPPYNVPIKYVVEASGNVSDPTASRFVPSTVSWLLHPANPELSLRLTKVTELSSQKRASRAGLFQVYNSTRAVAITSGFRDSTKAGMTVSVLVADVPAMWALVADDSPLLINTIASPGWDVTWEWVQPDDVEMENKANATFYRYRSFNLPYTVVEQPLTDITGSWDYRALSLEFADYQAVSLAFNDYAAETTHDRSI